MSTPSTPRHTQGAAEAVRSSRRPGSAAAEDGCPSFFSFHPFWISNCKSVKTKARYSHYPGERHQGGMTRILRRHLRATSIATISDRFVVFCVRVLASFIITSAWREALYIKKNLGYFPSLWWIYLDTSVRCNHKPKKYIYITFLSFISFPYHLPFLLRLLLLSKYTSSSSGALREQDHSISMFYINLQILPRKVTLYDLFWTLQVSPGPLRENSPRKELKRQIQMSLIKADLAINRHERH